MRKEPTVAEERKVLAKGMLLKPGLRRLELDLAKLPIGRLVSLVLDGRNGAYSCVLIIGAAQHSTEDVQRQFRKSLAEGVLHDLGWGMLLTIVP